MFQSNREKLQRVDWSHLLVGGLIIFATALLIPQCVGLFLLQRGAETLAHAEREERNRSLLNDSIADLKRAAELMPSNPTPLRYLARALQHSGRLNEAVSVLEQAVLLEPQSLLIKQELMLAYHLVGKRDEHLEADLDFNFDRCIEIGDGYLNIGNSTEALEWYDRASRLWPEQSETLLFRRWIARIQLGDHSSTVLSPTIRANIPDLEIIHLKDPYTVAKGSLIRRIPSGESLKYNAFEAVWWSNGRGSLIASVDQPGLYQVKVTAFDGGTPPINMAFGINGKMVYEFSLTKGDNSWTTIDFQVTLDQSLVTLDIWFLNDIWIPSQGVFRDAIVKQIEIWRISEHGYERNVFAGPC